MATTDKRLASVDAENAKARAQEGQALTLKQLALVIGYSYSTVRFLAKQPGFPILAGKVTLDDYNEWRRRRLGLA